LRAAGRPPRVVTGGGTGTVATDLAGGVYTEVQPGSYAFMDADYAANRAAADEALRFEHALFLATTVISTALPGQVVLDCGLKTLSAESGPPQPWPPRPGWGPVALNDEHGVMAVTADAAAPALGEVLQLVPGHCDPSFNLHDTLVLLRSGSVAGLWPIAARGHSR
jgi:D-serine deaminase-like pyridoxal phosphate-dependent protein